MSENRIIIASDFDESAVLKEAFDGTETTHCSLDHVTEFASEHGDPVRLVERLEGNRTLAVNRFTERIGAMLVWLHRPALKPSATTQSAAISYHRCKCDPPGFEKPDLAWADAMQKLAQERAEINNQRIRFWQESAQRWLRVKRFDEAQQCLDFAAQLSEQ